MELRTYTTIRLHLEPQNSQKPTILTMCMVAVRTSAVPLLLQLVRKTMDSIQAWIHGGARSVQGLASSLMMRFAFG